MMEAMLMIRPQPRPIIGSSTALVQWNTESRFVWMTSSHSDALILRMLRSRLIPALFTRMSTGPSCFAACSRSL